MACAAQTLQRAPSPLQGWTVKAGVGLHYNAGFPSFASHDAP